jgi:hypothetical protein
MALGLYKKLADVRTTLDAGRDELDRIRDQISKRRQELESLEWHHVDEAEAIKRIDKAIAYTRAQGVGSGFQDARAVIPVLIQDFDRTFESPFALLACLAPELLKAGLAASLTPDGLSPEAKAARETELLTEISGLEVEEERLARELESAGAVVPRRSDASPSILLASDREL